MVLKFYVYIGNDLMHLKNITYLFVTVIYSGNIYAMKPMALSLYFSFSWLNHFPYRFFTWLLLPNYLVLISAIYLRISKLIHKKIYAIAKVFLPKCYGVNQLKPFTK